MTTTDKSLPSTQKKDSSGVEGLWLSFKSKTGKLFGKDVCRLGSPYTIGLALMVIGFLSFTKVLPLGHAVGLTLNFSGAIIFIIATVKHSEKKILKALMKEDKPISA